MLLRDTPKIIVKTNNEQFILMTRNRVSDRQHTSVPLHKPRLVPQRLFHDEIISERGFNYDNLGIFIALRKRIANTQLYTYVFEVHSEDETYLHTYRLCNNKYVCRPVFCKNDLTSMWARLDIELNKQITMAL